MKSARLLALSVALLALPAHATSVDIGLGAYYWINNCYYYSGGHGLFMVTLGVRGGLARHLSIGGRFGAAMTTLPYEIGAPIDLELRAHLGDGRVHLAGYLGPWIFFTENYNAPLRI